MNEGKKTKAAVEKAKATGDVARPRNESVGEMLRAARTAKKLSVEEVSVALRIRASQLRVIEENNIDALPGMTYAVGFVRSYANYLGLDGVEIVHKFKAEHGQAPAHAPLSFPEPVAESRMPDPLMVGVGAFLAIVVLVIWTIYSNTHKDAVTIAEQVPPAPAVESILPHSDAAATPVVADAAAPAAAAAPTPVAEPAAKTEAVAEKPVVAETDKTEASAQATAESQLSPAPAVEPTKQAAAEEADEVINIKREKSRITLQSKQTSWVQVTDSRKGVIYKKVLKPGEKYYVPDQSGLTLATANAGGIEVYVDGQKAPPLGQSGEILRGISLDPSYLKRKRIKVND